MSPMPNGGASLGVCGGSVWCIGACFYLYLKHIPLFYFMFFPLSLIKRRIWTNHVHEVCVFNSTVTWQAISCSCFAAWCRKQFYWDFRWRLLRYMMKSTCCRVRGPNSYRRKHFCFATEGTIFITCNSVSSPNGKWFTSLGTGHQSSCHSDARVVKSTGGGGGQDCHSASHWTAGHRDDWWTAVYSGIYFFTRTDKKERLEKWPGLYLIWAVVKWRMWVCVIRLVVTSTNLIRSSCPSGTKAHDWCSEMSFLTLWHKVVVFRGCGGHITVTGGGLRQVASLQELVPYL